MCLLSGCTTGNLKDSLTTPPPASSAAGSQSPSPDVTGATVTSGSTTPSAKSAAMNRKGATAGSAGHVAASSQRSGSERGGKTTAASQARSSPLRQQGTATRNAPFVEQGVAKSGTYPKFVPPKAATSQMTDEQKKKFEKMMAERIKANKQPAETPAEAAEREKLLKALAAKHAQDMLKTNGIQ